MHDNLEYKKTFRSKVTIVSGIFIILSCIVIFYILFFPPLKNYNKEDYVFHVSSSQNLSSISEELKNNKIIRSKFLLKSFIYIFKSDKYLNQGDYLFKYHSSVIKIAWQLSRAKHKIDPIKVTLREGLTNEEIANILSDKLTNIDKDKFLELSYHKQGYLFPDTYFFFPLDSTEEVIEKLSNNFDNQIEKTNKLISASGKNLSDVIIMASIIEKEARGEKDAYLISGILWKRLKIGMPLQVDASPITYSELGLPDRAISNPGLLSIKSAIKPISSSYLYYLHDKEGNIHFAKDYDEHKSNIEKYLK